MKSTNFVLAACLCLLGWQSGFAQKQADLDWVKKHYSLILDETLPIERASLAFRYYKDEYPNADLEYSVVFDKNWKDDRLSVVVRMADAVSLFDQALALHLKNLDKSIKSIKPKLKIKEWRFNDNSCSVIKSLYEEFYQLKLEMLSKEAKEAKAKGERKFTLTVNPRVYTFRAYISEGALNLIIDGEPWDHPFMEWAMKTRRALETCGVSRR